LEADVSDEDVAMEMTLPLDSDGFLRRECPTCEREFKWLCTPADVEALEDTEAQVPDGGYFCPYCGVQAEPNSWLTRAQAELADSMVATRVLGPMLKDFEDDLKQISRRSGGILRAEMKYDPPPELDPLTEVDDMTRVDFSCHPTQPVKVLDDWDRSVRCFICGRLNT
jgi:hypothetical protein